MKGRLSAELVRVQRLHRRLYDISTTCTKAQSLAEIFNHLAAMRDHDWYLLREAVCLGDSPDGDAVIDVKSSCVECLAVEL